MKPNYSLYHEITKLLNSHCIENRSNTPDYILAEYLMNCLKNYNETINKRDRWYNVWLEPCYKFFYENEEDKNKKLKERTLIQE